MKTCRTQCLWRPLALRRTREPGEPLKSTSVLFFALLLVPLGAFTPALEAMDGGGQEEARHDGHHRHRDAGEDDDEQVRESQGGLALAEAVL